jgi:transposase-like protein
MKLDITNKIYNDEDAAREHLEAQLWPNGPFCPHCGSTNVTALKGKSHRKGLYQCNDCREQFSVTVGTELSRDHRRLLGLTHAASGTSFMLA